MNLYKHQQEAIDRAQQQNLALYHDCGTGKTLTALHIIRHWKSLGESPALVVCPLSIIEAAWMEDCKRFTPELSIVNLHSKKPLERIDRLENTRADIYIANYETFKGLYDRIVKRGFRILICDESSKMKDNRSQITKALLSLAGIGPGRTTKPGMFIRQRPIPHRYVLSGTPAPNDETEYWAQIKFLTGFNNDCLNANFYSFRGQYCRSRSIGMGRQIWEFLPSKRSLFMDAIKPVTHIVRKEDALDLPEQVHEIRYVELSDEEQGNYDTMENDYIIRFGNEVVLALNKLTEIMKLRQLTSGFCYGADGNVHTIGSSKLNELKQLLGEIGKHQVIIWCNFKHEINLLLRELKDSQALFSDTVLREKVIRDFQDGKFRYLIANPQSAGHGLTFVNCSYAVYYSVNYSYELQKQSEDRIHRIGQTNKTTYYYLLVKGTIDEVIYKAVSKKEDLSKTILSYLRNKDEKEIIYGKEAAVV